MEKYNLVPADTYVVVNKTILHNEDRKIITSLYLPIIGTDAVMLYFTLWADLDNSEILSSEFSHQKLVSSLRITINELQTSFDKLEAIGLIKAFIKEGNVNNYIYEILVLLVLVNFYLIQYLILSYIVMLARENMII